MFNLRGVIGRAMESLLDSFFSSHVGRKLLADTIAREIETKFVKLVDSRLELRAGRLKRQLKAMMIAAAEITAKAQAEIARKEFQPDVDRAIAEERRQLFVEREEFKRELNRIMGKIEELIATLPKSVGAVLSGVLREFRKKWSSGFGPTTMEAKP